ncbi:hypothetical protein ABKN59_009960 [Abortiporus biennis]
MMVTTILNLPTELILRTCQYMNDPKAIAAVARTCRMFRQIATPLLYRSIKLTNCQSAYACCQTLAADSNQILAGYVISFEIGAFIMFNFTSQHHILFRRWLVWSIERMANLRNFACRLHGSFGPDMCFALSKRTSLMSLDISLPESDQPQYQEPPHKKWSHSALQPRFPRLLHFGFADVDETLSNRTLSPKYHQFVRHMLTSHRHSLRSIHIPCWIGREYCKLLIPPTLRLNVLHSLTIRASAINLHMLTQMPHVKVLSIPMYEYRGLGGGGAVGIGDVSIPENVFPELETYNGPCRYFEYFVRGRSIKRVQFDGSKDGFEEESVYAVNNQAVPSWDDVDDAIQLLRKSNATVVHLSFYVKSMWFSDLYKDAIRRMYFLESLSISLREDPKDINRLEILGKKFFSRLPFLHTFLLSDEPFFGYKGSRFSFANDLKLQRACLAKWNKRRPSLVKVSFTAFPSFVHLFSIEEVFI